MSFASQSGTRTPPAAPAAVQVLALAFVALMLVAQSARAQEGTTPAPPPPDSTEAQAPSPAPTAPPPAATTPAPAAAVPDTAGILLPVLADVRSREEIQKDVDSFRAQRQGAENRMLRAREREIRWKSQADAKKSEIDLIKKKMDQAKKEKRQGDLSDLEKQKKKAELTRGFYEDLRRVYESEALFQQAAFDYFQARLTACDVESRLAERWGMSGDPSARLSSDSRDLELRAIQAVKVRADKMAILAAREKDLSDRKQAALEGWAELVK